MVHQTSVREAERLVASPSGYELTRIPLVARWLRRRSWQFQVILPNQILFWVVILVGFAGPVAFDENFATTITWYVWFTLVFALVLLTGRGWCAVCPFGGLAEWVQRGRLWHGRGPAGRGPGCGRRASGRLAAHGYVTTAVAFGVLTWVEEYYAVSDGSSPVRTSWTVLGIIGFALVVFLALERRSFCRYLCPLGGLIGVLGSGAPVAGFRARDRRVCLECSTKDCLRGNAQGYGCPWLNWPGGSDTNLNCGLCGECFRTCPSDNVGLFVERPLAGLLRSGGRRADVAWTVALLGGVMLHQHLHETALWARVDTWANGVTGFPHGPNPLFSAVLIAGYTGILVLPARLASSLVYRRPRGGLPARGDSFVHRTSPFRAFLLPLTYAAIPLLGCDYLAVGLPAFVHGAAKVVPAAASLLGLGSRPQSFTQIQLVSASVALGVQIALLTAGAAASALVAWRIGDELATVTGRPRAARGVLMALMIVGGVALVGFYVATGGEAG